MHKLTTGSFPVIFSVIGALILVAPLSALAAGPSSVNLGSSATFAILSKAGISTTGVTSIVGDLGVSPAAATSITGFSLSLTAGSAYATSPEVSGNIYAPDYAVPTPTTVSTAVSDMQTAYTDGAGRTNPTATELGAGNIGGLTLAPGLYKWSSGVTIPTSVTLAGSASDVWIFQIAQNLTVASGAQVILSGGAQSSNVFWIVAGQTTIGTTASFSGTILDQTNIAFNTGATLNGRALAQTAVTLQANSVTLPAGSSPAPTPVQTTTTTTTTTPPATVSGSTVTTYTAPVAVTSASAAGQAITLGNGQVVYVRSDGSFANAQGQVIAPTTISSSSSTTVAPSVQQPVTTIAVDLTLGSRGSGVTVLQQFLISQNVGSAASALSAVGATGYFGVLTQAALSAFQAHAGISPSSGYFGPITRAYLSAQY